MNLDSLKKDFIKAFSQIAGSLSPEETEDLIDILSMHLSDLNYDGERITQDKLLEENEMKRTINNNERA